MAYVIILPILWKVNNILPYHYKYSDKINRFCSINGWFLIILANFIKNFSQNAKFWSVRPKELCFWPIACSNFAPKSIHQIAWFQLEKCKIFQLLRGAHPPSDTPLARIWCWHATKSATSMSKMDLRPCNCHLCTVNSKNRCRHACVHFALARHPKPRFNSKIAAAWIYSIVPRVHILLIVYSRKQKYWNKAFFIQWLMIYHWSLLQLFSYTPT